jgi:hypothetical protein
MVNGSLLLIALGCPVAFALGYFLPTLLNGVPGQHRAAVIRATPIPPAPKAVTRGTEDEAEVAACGQTPRHGLARGAPAGEFGRWRYEDELQLFDTLER